MGQTEGQEVFYLEGAIVYGANVPRSRPRFPLLGRTERFAGKGGGYHSE